MPTASKEDCVAPELHEATAAAYVVWADNGNCLMWTTSQAQAEACAAKHQRPMRKLYDQDEVIALNKRVAELLLAEEGAAEAFGAVVQAKRALEAEVKRLQSLLDCAYASIQRLVNP
jgi:replicative superfamily II helicase